MEKEHGRVIKYPESYTVPKLISALDYFENMKIIEKLPGKKIKVLEVSKLSELIEKFAKDIGDQISINIKLKNSL